MTEEKRKSLRFWFFMSAPLVVGILVFLVTVFPTASFGENTVRMFALERLSFDGRGFGGRVFGSHVLETKYGEITLNRFARVYSRSYRVITMLYEENFANGRASHNLVVEGMVIPQQARIILNPATHQLGTLIFAHTAGLPQVSPEIIISSVPSTMSRINFTPPFSLQGGGTADIVTDFVASGYVTLADGVQIYFPLQANGRPMDRILLIDKDERWRIFTRSGRRTTLRMPGETEFVEYREITFSPHWGEFIEGVRVE